jgi:hypothetical protein
MTGDRVLAPAGAGMLEEANQGQAGMVNVGQARLAQVLAAQRAQTARGEKLADEQSRRQYQSERDKRSQAEAMKRALVMAGLSGARRVEDRAAKVAQNVEADIPRLGKELEPLAQMKTDIETLEGFAARDDIPGFGPVAGYVPDFMQGQEGTQARQAAGRTMANILMMQSGKAVSDKEVERQLQARGIGPRASPTQFREGVKALATEARDAAGRREAWFKPEVREALRARGGTTSEDFGPVRVKTVEQARALPKGTRFIDPEGNERVR